MPSPSQPSTHQSKPKRRGRPQSLPPDVNARNLALEKGRREDVKKDLLGRTEIHTFGMHAQ